MVEGRGGPVFLGVGLVSLCVLMLQLTLTRLFSATMYYHFAFLAISLALFGSGASGVAVYLLQRPLRRVRTARALSAAAALFALTVVLALVVVLRNPLSPVDPPRATLVRLVRIYAATALPFYFAGLAVTLAIARFAGQISRLYPFDLGGAAAGCLLLIPVLDRLGAVDTMLGLAVLAAGAAALFESASGGGRRYRAGLGLLAVGLAALFAWNRQTGHLDVRKAKGLDEAGHVIFSKWNSFSRVTVWGSLENDTALIMIDADAATEVTRRGSDLPRHAYLADRIEALAYHLQPGGRALILGPGGGNDVIVALLFGAREVTAVEVNPIIARDVMSAEPFRSWSGSLYEQPGVRLVVDEARSFIRSSGQRYDLIQGTMVDTWAATAAGAFALTENNLYTVEAFVDYFAHLAPQGILSMTRWYLEPPDQLLRLCSLARATMAELDLSEPDRHLMLVRGPAEAGSQRAPATFLFKKTPFTAAEVEVVEALAARNGFHVLYTPRSRPANAFTRLIEAEDPQTVWRSLPSDVTPTRDNTPFFFHTARLSDLPRVLSAEREWRKTNLGTFVLLGLLVLTTLVTAAFILGPLAVARGRALVSARAPTLAWLLLFACLGAGFIIVEVALVQKCILFLGHPVYSLAVVLFSLLTFSAVGSRLSGRAPEGALRPWLAGRLALVVALVVASSLVLSPLFYALVHLDRPWRIAITAAVLAPLGLAMGMPLPAGVRILAREAPEIVSWGWGVNGAASVLGSVAALVIALASGFNQALWVASGLYTLALLLVVGPLRLQPGSSAC